LQDALYRYDAIGRLQEANLPEAERKRAVDVRRDPLNIGRFIRLGPVGSALLPRTYPRVLLIDEIDKSDVDLPNDLLHVLEEGRYEIPELTRISAKQPYVQVFPYDSDQPTVIARGRVACAAFPIIILTSNREREFPPAFLRRCIRLNIPDHSPQKLAQILDAYFGPEEQESREQREQLIQDFVAGRARGDLSTDQLLNAVSFCWPATAPRRPGTAAS
jgi:MoxR-like ATPase